MASITSAPITRARTAIRTMAAHAPAPTKYRLFISVTSMYISRKHTMGSHSRRITKANIMGMTMAPKASAQLRHMALKTVDIMAPDTLRSRRVISDGRRRIQTCVRTPPRGRCSR